MKTHRLIAASLLAAVSGLAADEVRALSQNGGHRLCLKSVEQVKSPWDEKVHALSLFFRLEYMQGGGQFVSQAPENVFLEGVEPLDEVILPSGENVAAHKHSAWTDESSSEAVIHTLEVGKEQKQLRKLKLALTLVKVTEWQQLEFKGLKRGKNATLHCGPFEIDCTGEAKLFVVSAASYSEFSQEHENYRKRMPLGFVDHRHAINHVRITDSGGRAPGSLTATGTGGSTSGSFSFQQPLNLSGVPAKAEEPVAYPVTLRLQLPRKYETEHVTFEFKDVDLPPLEKSRKQ